MVYRILHRLSPTYLQDTFNTLQLLPPMLAETVIAFLCREFGPLMAKTVSFI